MDVQELTTSNLNLNVNDSQTELPIQTEVFIDSYLSHVICVVNYAIICQIIVVFGIVTNVINIYVFIKLGFADTVNISLLGLSISDLGCLVPLIWHNICFNPLFRNSALPFDPITHGWAYLTAGWPHVVFTRTTSWITAFIALERCLCIAIPMRVKSLLTQKRVTFIIAGIFLVLLGGAAPTYYANRYEHVFNDDLNDTVLTLTFTPDREKIESISFLVNILLVNVSSFVVVLICSAILLMKLASKAKWRNTSKAVANSNSSAMSARDSKVTKMVVVISAMFIFCFTPVSIVLIVSAVEPEFSILGKYKNLFFVTVSIGFILESVNSSVNVFVYYEMSSKYREVIQSLRCCRYILNNDSNRTHNADKPDVT